MVCDGNGRRRRRRRRGIFFSPFFPFPPRTDQEITYAGGLMRDRWPGRKMTGKPVRQQGLHCKQQKRLIAVCVCNVQLMLIRLSDGPLIGRYRTKPSDKWRIDASRTLKVANATRKIDYRLAAGNYGKYARRRLIGPRSYRRML